MTTAKGARSTASTANGGAKRQAKKAAGRGAPQRAQRAQRAQPALPQYLYTKEQAAEALLASVRTVERLIATGKLRALKPGKRVGIPVDAIESYIANTTGRAS